MSARIFNIVPHSLSLLHLYFQSSLSPKPRAVSSSLTTPVKQKRVTIGAVFLRTVIQKAETINFVSAFYRRGRCPHRPV